MLNQHKNRNNGFLLNIFLTLSYITDTEHHRSNLILIY